MLAMAGLLSRQPDLLHLVVGHVPLEPSAFCWKGQLERPKRRARLMKGSKGDNPKTGTRNANNSGLPDKSGDLVPSAWGAPRPA